LRENEAIVGGAFELYLKNRETPQSANRPHHRPCGDVAAELEDDASAGVAVPLLRRFDDADCI